MLYDVLMAISWVLSAAVGVMFIKEFITILKKTKGSN